MTEFQTETIALGIGKVEIKIDNKDRIIDYATGKVLKSLSKSPEEPVRQWYEHILIDEYGYDPKQISIEVPVQMGVKSKSADIVVYDSPEKTKKIVVVETKRPDKKDGIKQLHSYLDASGTEFGVWTNGNDISYWYHEKPQSYEPIGRLVKRGETIDDFDSMLLREDLVPAKNLLVDFDAIEQYLIAHQGGLDTFNEIFKLIFAKIYDEKRNLKTPKSEVTFRAGLKEPASRVKDRINMLFEGAKKRYSDVIQKTDEIKLSNEVLKWIVLLLQNYYLTETDMDILGAAFEHLINPKMKFDKGQYFTPRQVVRAAVEMLQINEDMKIVDPACGSGGFLIYSMERVFKIIENEWADPKEAQAEQNDFAKQSVFGLDYDDRLARVAKAYMAIWGDGRAHIYSVPCSIKNYEWSGEVEEQVKDGIFDAVLTNPPFAGDLNIDNIAFRFDLGKKKKNGEEEELAFQRKDILFIERVIKLAKPSSENENSGLIAIVLPKGDLDEREKQYVRDYILENTRILAVISLHKFTFEPYTGQKTSLVVLKRMPKEQIPSDYDIYMAVSESPGKDKSGNLKYVANDSGVILDNYGRPKLDTDLFEISKEFVDKAQSPKIGFWVKRSELNGRINAEYYHPKYMKIRKEVIRNNYALLSNLLANKDKDIINGIDISSKSKDGKRRYSENGAPYLRVGDVLENETDLVGAEKIDLAEYDISKLPELQLGDILLTRKGTTGRAAVVTNDELGAVISSEIIRIRLKGKYTLPNGEIILINPYYVAAYINSIYGKQLILQKQTGGISEGINQPDLKEIEIPIFSQETMDGIADDYLKSNANLKNARKNIIDTSVEITNLIKNIT